jgi:hypothetical protein
MGFEVTTDDKSMQYIGMVFGPMGNLPLTGGNLLFSNIMYLLNQIIFALAIILVASMTVVGTINTAQEGDERWTFKIPKMLSAIF